MIAEHEEDNLKNGATQKSDTSSPAQKKAQSNANEGESKQTGSLFKGVYAIDFKTPLPEFRVAQNQVFLARHIERKEKCIAILALPETLPRFGLISSYKGLQLKNLLNLLDYGVLKDGPDGREYMVFIFEYPGAAPVLKSWQEVPARIEDDALIEGFVKPIVMILREFHQQDLVHGAINLRNIYLQTSGEGNIAVLGECISHAASMTQHILYEPLERALASPEGRGVGTSQDDLYAFGMCVAIMARAENPVAHMSENEILQRKIETGSYSIIIGRERLPGGLTEFLRGVLNDDKTQRWGFEDVEKWLEGRRLSPRQPKMQQKAPRGYPFQNEKHEYLKNLVMAFTREPSEASAVLSSENFLNWFKRNVEDTNLAANIESIMDRNKGMSQMDGMKERFVAEMCIGLDPVGPIRYRGISVLPRNLGNALAHAFATEQDVQPFAQIINYQMIATWLSMQLTLPTDAAALSSQLDRCRQFLNQKMPGYGIERIVYMLSKDAPCLSPQFMDCYVMNAGMLLEALEKKAKQNKISNAILDRHMVAFLSVRDQRMIEPHLSYVNSAEETFQVLGVIKTMSAIQKSYQLPMMPHFCDLLINRAQPAIDRIYGHKLKEKMLSAIQSLKGKGDFNALLGVLDNSEVIQKDAQMFVMARREFHALELEARSLEAAIQYKKNFGLQKGRQTAMTISAVFGTLLFLMNVFMFLLGRF